MAIVSATVFGGLFLGTGLHSGNGLGILGGLVILGLAAWEGTKYVADAPGGKVMALDGDAYTEFEGGGEGPNHYWLHIGDLKLEITAQAHSQFLPGGPYRVFYLPVSRKVVSGVVLPGWRRTSAPIRKRPPWWKQISIEIG